jgi:hypothetical protein
MVRGGKAVKFDLFGSVRDRSESNYKFLKLMRKHSIL